MAERIQTLIVLRLHRRVNLLPRIRESLDEALRTLPNARLALALNSPTPEVEKAASEFRAQARVTTTLPAYDPTLVPADGHGRIQSAVVDLLEREFDWEWIVWQCDDWVLQAGGWKEMAGIMVSGTADAIAADALYFWDERRYNLRAYRTIDEIAYRWRRGLRWGALDVGYCPQDIQYEARVRDRVVVMEKKRLDFGFATEEERSRAAEARKRAGLVDSYLLPLLLEPELVEYENEPVAA